MNIKEKLYNNIENLKNEIENISEFVFEHAELGNEEYISSAYLVQKLKEYGFQVTYPYLDIPTAFRAEYKKGDGLNQNMMHFQVMEKLKIRMPMLVDITG